MLALLFGVLASFTPAQAEVTIWSATLTPAATIPGISAGCDNTDSNSANHCSNSSVLSDDEFTYAGTVYQIIAIDYIPAGGTFAVAVDTSVPQALRDSGTFHVGNVSVPLSGQSNQLVKDDSAPTGLMTAGTPVTVKIVLDVVQVSLSPTALRVNEGEQAQFQVLFSSPPDDRSGLIPLVSEDRCTLYARYHDVVTGISFGYDGAAHRGIQTIYTRNVPEDTICTIRVDGDNLPEGYIVGNGILMVTIVDVPDTRDEGGDDGGDDGGDNTDDTPTGGINPGGTPSGGGGSPSGGGGGGGGSGGGGGGGGPPAQSSDASLDTLEVGGDSLDLDPDTDNYPINAYGETSLILTPTASDTGVRITVNGNTVRSGTPHTVTLEDAGVTSIEIVVTAEDGTTRTYTLTVMSCPGEERKILEMFYHSTQGDMWEQSGGWNTEDDLDDWHGVDIDEDGEVISLRLPDNGLSGDIPSALLCFDELSGLLELALWDNDSLSGKEPEELALAVERAVLRDVAEALSLNAQWFDDYEDPFNFSDWHEGVTTDDDERVTELDFTGEDITGEIPGSVFELKRLRAIETGCEVTLEVEAPGRVSVVPDDCLEETPPEDMEEMEEEETAASGGGGCAVGQGDSSLSGLFLLTLVVFAALVRRRVLD